MSTISKPPMRTALYSVSEAAKAWHVPVSVMYAEIRAGRLKAVMRRGCVKGYLVTEAIMDEWVENSLVSVEDFMSGNIDALGPIE